MKTITSRVFSPLLILLICSGIAFAQQTGSETIPPNWKREQPVKHFTFYLPRHAWDTGFHGLDEIYKEYRVGKMRLTFTYDPMGVTAYDRREQKFGKGFEETVIEIDGQKAYLYKYVQILRGQKRYHTDLYVGDFPNADVKLWATADSWRSQDVEVAYQIFRTVEFIEP